eukprot:COSAG01_NODE_16326_length_1245_cov_131.439791_1_plen_123_part_00
MTRCGRGLLVEPATVPPHCVLLGDNYYVYECTELPTSTASASRYTVECQSLEYIRRNLADLEDGSRNALDTVDVRAALGFGPLGRDGEVLTGTTEEQQDISMEALEAVFATKCVSFVGLAVS